MPLQATSGAASYDAFGGGVAAVPNYIEDVFSTWLYTGNGSTQTINNGIDLAGKGGLVWQKTRNQAFNHALYDTARGTSGGFGLGLISNSTSAQVTGSGNYLTTFNSNGFTASANGSTSGDNWVSWTFREQPKFFDVVTWTGNGAARTIAHNLGSVPGCIIIKCLDDTFDWIVWHRSFAATNQNAFLNTTDAASAYGVSSSTAPTSTVFSLTTSPYTNQSGKTYVAYVFAHNAGGFGLSGTDNVISCGSFAANANTTVNLGYEPQWILFKNAQGTNNWGLVDNMRGWLDSGNINVLAPNLANGETTENSVIRPTATGFQWLPAVSGNTYIYIAIRRGPMKTPTTGTSVFAADLGSSSGLLTYDSNFVVDFAIDKSRTASPSSARAVDRLRGAFQLLTPSTDAESSSTVLWDSNTNLRFNNSGDFSTRIGWLFSRAPGFFDVCCYTGTGVYGRTINHNLGVVPELIIVKQRSLPRGWAVYSAAIGNTRVLQLNTTAGQATDDWFANTTPTSTVFSVGSNQVVNENTQTFVAYLFASCPGVSKVGSYTGTGSTQTINCGFTAGARFVLIKRTDSTGAWFVWDTARGMVSGTDPRLALNNTDAEINQNWVYTSASGFQIVTSNENVNTDGGTYIFLAIA